jgi:CRISPR-associated exonuclease Cas4
MEGRYLHCRVDEEETEIRGDIRICRGLRLRSLRLGLVGKADVVEFHRLPDNAREGMCLKEINGFWQPIPIEYKRGKPKPDICDEVQLCAQALCLEEMTGTKVPEGRLFYGMPRRRYEVLCNDVLRQEVEKISMRLHKLTEARKTPAAQYGKKCKNCSLYDFCMPKVVNKGPTRVKEYISGAIFEAISTE